MDGVAVERGLRTGDLGFSGVYTLVSDSFRGGDGIILRRSIFSMVSAVSYSLGLLIAFRMA